jgi:hypothetical protein
MASTNFGRHGGETAKSVRLALLELLPLLFRFHMASAPPKNPKTTSVWTLLGAPRGPGSRTGLQNEIRAEF